MTNKIIPVILSGGAGTRLWPLSRAQHPKQYLRLISENTMLQETILRLNGLDNVVEPIVVCSNDHRFLVANQLQQIEIKGSTIILEPVARNTAAAIAAAAMQAMTNKNDKDVLLVLPADHFIRDIQLFHKAIQNGFKQAQNEKLVTFGVVPSSPNPNFGYIKVNDFEEIFSNVDKFIEKPNSKKANEYIEQGNYLWNSGMFMFQVGTFLNELSEHSNEISKKIKESVHNAEKDLDFIRLEKSSFESSPSNSIDYELMEKSKNVVAISLDVGWSDIGSFDSLHEIGKKDINGNNIRGDVFTEDTFNCFVHSESRLVATIGLKDLCIIDTPNAILISEKKEANKVKDIISQLKKENREEQFFHRKVYRPWGWYDSIEMGRNFQVKKLHVKSGAKLSLQYHNERAEHWVVVKGIANITIGDSQLILKEGESTFIQKKIKHSLSNQEANSLEIIEIQSGSYLGEDDIIRLEDIYGRINK